MYKQQLLLTCAMFLACTGMAQIPNARRYKDVIFKDIPVVKDQSYNPNAAKNEQLSYLFDLYQPKGDDNTPARPLIIWMHGGGFKFGSKTSKGVKVWSKSFAQRGYVCASINYRLGKTSVLLHFDALLKAAFYATQDAKLAVAYFRANAARYNIDPNKIILGGNSAGGFIALEAPYSQNLAFGRMADLPDAEINASGAPDVPVYAVINYWGGIFNLDWLKNGKTPIISVHGDQDGLVPITHKSAPLYGSLDIHNKADELHIPNTLKIYSGYSHELQKHFNPIFEGPHAEARWLEAAQFTADYLYGMMQK
jgi:acetyl esterase/lipase